MARQHLDPAAAERLMDDTDRNRERYHREYYDRDWADPSHFHLVLNTGLLGYQEAGNVIVDCAGRLGWKAPTGSTLAEGK